MINVSVIGGTGYTGVELLKILQNHPMVRIKHVISNTHESNIDDVFPSLYKIIELYLEKLNVERISKDSDVVFLALPHGVSSPIAKELFERNVRVIDLGADFRFRDIEIYKKWYEMEHRAVELLDKAVYGLPEIYKAKIKEASIIGNPGCYPTSVILALAPLAVNRLIYKEIIVDSKSGISGAGRGLTVGSLFCECNENVRVYNVFKHRHKPEMEEVLKDISKEENLEIVFTPHLVPMTRGILSTIYCRLKKSMKIDEIRSLYEDFYSNSYFIRILKKGVYPQTKCVFGSNFCDIGLFRDEDSDRLIIASVIDNLFKGASGQAVQNMNLMFGLDEWTGLEHVPVYP